jgi:hypothetical protein
MDKEQFPSIRKAFGVAPETSTIKGICSYTSLWLDRNETASSHGLIEGCLRMVTTLDQAILSTEEDLNRTGATDELLAEPIVQCLEAYERLKEVVQDMADAVKKEDRSLTKELLDELEETADFLAEAQGALDAWLNEDVLRCPRCGAEDADPCSKCGLELLITDPQAGMGVREQSVLLPQEYGQVLAAYVAVRNGEKTLSELIRRLPLIEKKLATHSALVNASLQAKPDNQILLNTKVTIADVQAGIQIIRGTLQTRRMTELQTGWLQIYQNAGKLEELRIELLEDLGGPEGQAAAARERDSARQQDSVSFGPST